MGQSVYKSLVLAVALVIGAVVLRPRWASTIYSTKGFFVQFVGFGGVLLYIREQR